MEKNKNLIGTEIEKTFKLKIKIIDVHKEVPQEEVDNIKDWIQYKSIELGIGEHFEFYSYTKNYKDDIPITFIVKKI